jgi:hypothetical protein
MVDVVVSTLSMAFEYIHTCRNMHVCNPAYSANCTKLLHREVRLNKLFASPEAPLAMSRKCIMSALEPLMAASRATNE